MLFFHMSSAFTKFFASSTLKCNCGSKRLKKEKRDAKIAFSKKENNEKRHTNTSQKTIVEE